jgi:hypothetical protein
LPTLMHNLDNDISTNAFNSSQRLSPRYQRYHRSNPISSNEKPEAIFSQLQAVATGHVAPW